MRNPDAQPGVTEMPASLTITQNGNVEKVIRGVNVAVEVKGEPVWERTVYDRLTGGLGMFFNHPYLPFYEWRLKRTRQQAEKIARAVSGRV